MHDDTTSALLAEPRTGDDSAADAASRLRRGTTVGRYIVIDRLGGGGMGDVYSAWDEELRRRVALKLIRPRQGADVRAQVLAEARALARLRHPHVVSVHDVGEDAGSVFVSMALLEGLDLGDWAKGLAPDPKGRLEVIVQCAEGLAAAHDAGLVHHDVKPSNIVVETRDEEPWVSLIDFGLAADAESGDTPRGGTLAYMAPEARATSSGSARADQWSLALVAVELLTGDRPTADALSAGRIGACGSATAALRRALADDVEARHNDVHAFAEALRRGMQRRARRTAYGVLGGVSLLAVGTWAAAAHEEPDCGALARTRLDALVPGRAESLQTFEASAPQVASSVIVQVERWTDRWTEAYAQACQLPESSSRRACLEGDAREVAALLRVGAADQGTGAVRWAVLGSLNGAVSQDRCSGGAARPPLSEGLARAFALEVASRFDEAYSTATSELAVAREGDDRTSTIAALYRLASVERRRDNFENSLALGEEAMQLAAVHGDTWTQARAVVERVEAWISLGEYDRALEAAQLGRVVVAAAGDPPGLLSYWYYEQGRSFESASRFDDAVASYRRSLEIRRETDAEPLYVADTQRSLGSALSQLNQCDQGQQQLQASIATYVEHLGAGSPSEAYSLSALAQCQAQVGDREGALASSRRAEEILTAVLGPRSEALAKILTMQGVIIASQGDYGAARDPYERALEIRMATKGAAHPETIVAATNFGWMLVALGEIDAATPVLEAALRGATQLRGADHHANHQLLGAMAALHDARGELDLAIAMQRRALKAARSGPEASNPMTLVPALTNLGEVLAKAGQNEEAVSTYARVWSILDAAPDGHRSLFWGHVNLGRAKLAHAMGDDPQSFIDAAVSANPEFEAEVAALRE
ncbi:MAG: serine/threonine-protein kinase [Nannocystaceae bacterium]|nr:serine/threonine-protein kinase [Nannocystaceae bacterium]